MTNQEAKNVMEKYTDDTLSPVVAEGHKMAISALEKQIAKQPKDLNSIKFTGSIREQFKNGRCPSCDGYVDSDDSENFCSECGQKLMW